MTTARLWIVAILLTALVGGAAMYYLQVYAFYREVEAPATYIVADGRGDPARGLTVRNYRGIDADSSPIRYRACFDSPPLSLDRFDDVPRLAEPRPPNAPEWFDCFDARRIGEDIEAGTAAAFLSIPNYPTYGIDEIVAVYGDGRAYAWRQINACGEVVFDGNPPPEGCPPLPESE